MCRKILFVFLALGWSVSWSNNTENQSENQPQDSVTVEETAEETIVLPADPDEMMEVEDDSPKGWGGLTFGLSTIADEGVLLFGARGGILIGDFTFGAYVQTTSGEVDIMFQNEKRLVGYDALGLLMQWTYKLNPLLSLSTPLSFGAGQVEVAGKSLEGQMKAGIFIQSAFGAQLDFALSESLRISLGGNYQFFMGFNDEKYSGLDREDFTAPQAYVLFSFGNF